MIHLVLWAILAVAAVSPAVAQPPDRGAADEVRLMEMVLAAPLSASERAAISQAWDGVAQADPQAVSAYAARIATVLADNQHAAPQAQAAYRTAVRRGAALGECVPGFAAVCAAEAPAWEAHDPAIVVDRARKLVFTRATVVALVAGAQAISGRLQVNPPGSDAAGLIEGELRSRDALGAVAGFGDMQEAARYDLGLALWVRAAAPGPVGKMHDVIASQHSEADRVFFLAEAAALAGKRAQQVGSPKGTGAMAGLMAGAMRGQAMRTLSRVGSPRCMGPGTGANFGYCSGGL